MAVPQDVVGQVLLHIRGMSQDVARIQEHSQWLQRFQQAPEAWAICHELLAGAFEEPVQHFVAQTLVTKFQAGQLPNGGASQQPMIMAHLAKFQSGPHSVRQQLIVALVDHALWRGQNEDSVWLNDCLQLKTCGLEPMACLLKILVVLTEEVTNRKVVVDSARRRSFAMNMLQHTAGVFELLTLAAEKAPNHDILAAALQALSKWLHLQHASPALRSCKKTGDSYTADILKNGLHEHVLVTQSARVLENIMSSPLPLLRACADVLSDACSLTNETTPHAVPIQIMTMQAIVAGATGLLPATQVGLEKWIDPDNDLTLRLSVMGRLVGELGGCFARLVVARTSSNLAVGGGILDDFVQVALRFVQMRSTELARCGLDFWYAVLSYHLGATSEEEDPFEDDAASALVRGDTLKSTLRNSEAESQRRTEERPILTPYIQEMVKAHCHTVRYPAEPEAEPYFEWDEFVRFREVCSINITEACLVVTPRWIIEHVGTLLNTICAQNPIQWQDIDLCVFILTGVASRAPAGQDTVIPKLIDILPQLPYPTSGFKSLLLRSAASRLILFTSGYLALQVEPCKAILSFLTMQHLPAIPPLPQGPDKDAKKYCETIACDALKMVMTAARKLIVNADGGTFWKDLVSAVIRLVAEKRFNVDCRAQLVFGIGQVLSVLEDWDELEHMLGVFVKEMEAGIRPMLDALPAEPLGARATKQTADKKAPVELKLYIASVSSVYNMPPRDSQNRPPTHPVLKVCEVNYAVLEKVCLHHTQYEDLMEQVCLAFTYIVGFAREWAPQSPIFVPVLKLMARCCEQHPQPFYLGFVRSVIGIFAGIAPEITPALVELTGLFITPVARRLVPGCGPPHPPAINQAGYEMLAEAVRHCNVALAAIQANTWMPPILDATLEALPQLCEENQAIHEKTICAMLRYVRNLLLWADPETRNVTGGASTDPEELRELQQLETAAATLLQHTPLERGMALDRIMHNAIRLLVAAAQNNPAVGQVVPCTAEVLQALLGGPFEAPARLALPQVLQRLPPPLGQLLSTAECQSFALSLQQQKRDAKGFAGLVMQLAEQFAVALKKAQYS